MNSVAPSFTYKHFSKVGMGLSKKVNIPTNQPEDNMEQLLPCLFLADIDCGDGVQNFKLIYKSYGIDICSSLLCCKIDVLSCFQNVLVWFLWVAYRKVVQYS